MREKAIRRHSLLNVAYNRIAIEGIDLTVNAVYGYDQSDACLLLSFFSQLSCRVNHLIQSIYQCLYVS